MDKRAGSPHRSTQYERLQQKPTWTGVTIKGTSASSPACEREALHGLNHRLAVFIRKVQQLEQHNHLLERELEEVRGGETPASSWEEQYGPELRKLRQVVQDMTQQKHLAEILHRNLEEEVFDLKRQHEQEARARSDAQSRIVVLRRDIQDACQVQMLLDKRAQSLVDEIRLLRRTHEAELSEMLDQGHRRHLQAKATELDCAEGTREALEKQLHEVEDRHMEEMIHYQNTIKELEDELINCKCDMSGYLREYQDLLSVKVALDVEIMSYRKLLCGEESQLFTISDNHISLPYIYRQSPVYTLPCFSRPGDPLRRAEPRYKFVEEIITETTREIEMSEFEYIGRDKTDARKSKWERTKRDRRGSLEGKDEESKQMFGSQQNPAAPGSNSANGDDDQGKGVAVM